MCFVVAEVSYDAPASPVAQRANGESPLAAAVRGAVTVSASLLDDLQKRLDVLLQQVVQEAGDIPEVDALRRDLEDALERHRLDSETVRIVLFGRTGAGKSTFIEAFTQGDGSSISTGESDFTTSPRSVGWGPLELIDTPGYGGWGRTRTREELEAEAAGMVAKADLVVLCFDDQNQQESEFAVVRDQIQRFGRPCVAVLNVRNPRWREQQLGTQVAATLERQVTVHARHIRDELLRMGLPHVPVVAVHMQRAAAALASDDYSGHDAELVRKRRERFSRSQLADMSNVRRLEQLLVRCLVDGAPQLRLQSVENDLLARVQHVAEELTQTADDRALEVTVGVAALRASVDVLGAGHHSPTSHRGRWARTDVPGAEALLELAELRPELLDGSSPSGRLQQTAHELAAIHLSPHRRKLRAAAEDIAHQAIREQKVLDGDALVLLLEPHVDEARKAAAAAGQALSEEFSDQLAGVQLQLKVEGARMAAEAVDGRSGRKAARLLEAGELLTQAGTALAVFLAATGPVGWLAAAGGAVASLVVGWFRRRASRQAEARGAEVRAEAVSLVRRAADDVHQSLEQHFWQSVTQAATRAARVLIGDVAPSVATRAARVAALTTAANLLNTRSSGGRTDATDVIAAAVRAVRASEAPGSRRDPLLGQTAHGSDEGAGEISGSDHTELTAALQERADNWLSCRRDPEVHWKPEDKTRVFRVGVVGGDPAAADATADELRKRLDGAGWEVISAAADDAVSCDLLIWVLAPNLDLHSSSAARALLAPDAPHRHAVLSRSVLCISGLDQLGPDLLLETQAVPPVIARKAAELSNYLSTIGLETAPETVLFVAPTPFGLRPDEVPVDPSVFGLPQLAGLVSSRPRTTWARRWHEAIQAARLDLAEAEEKSNSAVLRLRQMDQVIGACDRSASERRRLLAESEESLRATITDSVDAMALRVCQAADASAMTNALQQLNTWPSDAIVIEALEAWQRQFLVRYEDLADEHAAELKELVGRQRLRANGVGGKAGSDATQFGKFLATTSQLASKAGQSRDTWYSLVKTVSRGTYKFKPWGAIKGANAAKALGARLAAVGIVITVAEQYFDRRATRRRDEFREQVLAQGRQSVDAALADYLWAQPSTDKLIQQGLFVPAQREIDALAASLEVLRRDREAASEDVEELLKHMTTARQRLEERIR